MYLVEELHRRERVYTCLYIVRLQLDKHWVECELVSVSCRKLPNNNVLLNVKKRNLCVRTCFKVSLLKLFPHNFLGLLTGSRMAKIMINRQFVAKMSIKYFDMTRKVFTHVHLTSLVDSA